MKALKTSECVEDYELYFSVDNFKESNKDNEEIIINNTNRGNKSRNRDDIRIETDRKDNKENKDSNNINTINNLEGTSNDKIDENKYDTIPDNKTLNAYINTNATSTKDLITLTQSNNIPSLPDTPYTKRGLSPSHTIISEDLIPGGSNIKVTSKNIEKYITKRIEHIIRTQNPFINEMKNGLLSVRLNI